MTSNTLNVTDHTAPRNDLFTIGAIAVIAYLLSVMIHEALGHGVAALLVGGHIQHITSLDVAYTGTTAGTWADRFVAAAGCLAQLIAAGILYTFYRRSQTLAPDRRYFLWLFTHINLLIPGGYLMALSFVSFGDWNEFVQGLPAPIIWRSALTLLGIGISFAALRSGSRGLQSFIGIVPHDRERRANTLTIAPYLFGGAINTLAGIFNPDSPALIITSAAAASFGGTIFLFWTGFVAGMTKAQPGASTIAVTRSVPWLSAGVVAVLIYFFVLGPGLPR